MGMVAPRRRISVVHIDETATKRRMSTLPVMEVELLHWPVDSDRLEELRCSGRARLLVIDPDTTAPVAADPLEDWIRRPASIHDLKARIAGLERRVALSELEKPNVDDCVLRFAGEWVSIPPVEMSLTRVLVQRFGTVVDRGILSRAGWPRGGSDRNALDVHVMRLRRRIDSVGLAIRTVRGHGYLLEATCPNTIGSVDSRPEGKPS